MESIYYLNESEKKKVVEYVIQRNMTIIHFAAMNNIPYSSVSSYVSFFVSNTKEQMRMLPKSILKDRMTAKEVNKFTGYYTETKESKIGDMPVYAVGGIENEYCYKLHDERSFPERPADEMVLTNQLISE